MDKNIVILAIGTALYLVLRGPVSRVTGLTI